MKRLDGLSRTLPVSVMASICLLACSAPGPEPPPPPDAFVGQTVTLDTTTYLVTAVRLEDTLKMKGGLFGGEGTSVMTPKDPSTAFFEVEMTVSSLTAERGEILNDHTTFFGGDGEEYPHLGALNDPSLPAGETRQLNLTFVIQRDAAQGATLRVKDLHTEATATIALDAAGVVEPGG
jgi:hypothetical protein